MRSSVRPGQNCPMWTVVGATSRELDMPGGVAASSRSVEPVEDDVADARRVVIGDVALLRGVQSSGMVVGQRAFEFSSREWAQAGQLEQVRSGDVSEAAYRIG